MAHVRYIFYTDDFPESGRSFANIRLTLPSFLLRLSDPQKVENVLYKPMKRIRIKKSDHRVVYLAFLLTFFYIINKLETNNQENFALKTVSL